MNPKAAAIAALFVAAAVSAARRIRDLLNVATARGFL